MKCQNIVTILTKIIIILQLGSYICVDECSKGYELKEGVCVDIDECLHSKLACDRRATCHNTLGGYECKCEEGFDGNGNNCYRN